MCLHGVIVMDKELVKDVVGSVVIIVAMAACCVIWMAV